MLKRTILFSAMTLAVAGCNSTSNISPKSSTAIVKNQTQFEHYSAETFFDTTSIMGSSFSHDGQRILVSSDETGIFNLYSIDVKNGQKIQLTESTDTTYPVRYFPNDERILLTRDQGGNELFHLYVQTPNGTITDLTPGDNVRASFNGFSDNEKSFYVSTNERDAKFMDLYRYDAKTYKRKLVYQNNTGLNVQSISPNDAFLALGKSNSNKDSDIYLLDLNKKNAKPKLISDFKSEAQIFANTFSSDNKDLYYTTNGQGEFSQVWRYNLKSGLHSEYLKDDWDINTIYFSKSGKYRVKIVNEDSSAKVSIIDTHSNQALNMPNLPAGSLSSVNFSADESHISFYLNSDTSPNNLYSWTVGSSKIQKLTSSLSPKINSANLVQSTIARFKSFDGLEVPGVLYKPKQASETNKVPAVVFVHGGPGGQSRTGYSAMKQHLVNQGYAVFAVNNRGSSGYGKTFNHLDDKKHGEDDLQDIVWSKKYLQSLDWVNADKIGIMGGSYGGYMTAAALAFEPEEFKVGVNIFGVTNWVRTLTSIPPWWESFKKSLYDEMGDPATDGKRHRRISPLFHAKNITKPLMVVQGANDPRVLQVESDELVEAVKANNVPVEYVLFNDEGHGFTKKANRITASNAYVTFLNKYLK
ncbi:S9 family peptidase [Pseudoalteromonas denitrificans]|uniref:Dipeptidyl aminopeptidase/acylaminoacyl peptidase n=1 Tax=Pseudoalteromonas denitrificans DSM 6059 TaxID=1123010 RepID=A0A1I1J1I2_9GAMM|nr:S9 family peptidase [Pseudoalteromonas denitrificans]SFC42364.1 Dipeptidyl aminopeptidase/acylaminoacyl peptidase [Pseudoalteromonas denitrificans DSM 6059]